MTDYQSMYYILCDGASRAIDAPPEEAKPLLQEALYKAEEIYIQTSGPMESEQNHKGRISGPNSKPTNKILRLFDRQGPSHTDL